MLDRYGLMSRIGVPPNRVGPPRRARGKQPVRLVGCGRRHQQVKALDAIKDPQHNQVRVAVDVGKAGLVGGQNAQHPGLRVLRAQALGNGCCVFEGTADKSDGLGSEHGLAAPPLLMVSERGDGWLQVDSVREGFGDPDRDRTDALFHALMTAPTRSIP